MRSTTVYMVAMVVTIAFLITLINPFSQTTNFGIDSDGQIVDIRTGGVFRIQLPENPSTGYSWDLKTSEGLVSLSDRYIPDDNSGRIVGGGGLHTWEFKAAEAGEQWVQGVYRRPWEAAKSDDKRYSLTLNVGGGGHKKSAELTVPRQNRTSSLIRLFQLPASFSPPWTLLSS